MWLVFYEPALCDILAILAMIAFIINYVVVYKKYIAQISFAEFMLVCFVIVSIHNVIQTEDIAYSVRYTGITAFVVMLFLFISRLSDSYDTINQQMNFFFVPALISASLIIFSYFAIIAEIDLGVVHDIVIKNDRPRGFFKDANVAGPFLIPPAIYSFATILNRKRKSNLMLLLIFLILVTGVFATLSRAAMISLLFSILLVMILSLNFKKLMRIALILIFCISSFSIFLYVTPQSSFVDRLYDLKFGVNDRMQRIERGIPLIMENPLFGTGMRLDIQRAPHDTFLLLMTQTGIIGTLCFWAPVIYLSSTLLIRSRNPLYEKNRIIMLTLGISLLSHIVFGIVISFLHWRHFWYMAGLAMATVRISEASASKKPS